jgi:hypothetical protein
VSGWVLAGGGSMSGTRATPTSPCVLKVDNPTGAFDARFGWGHSFEELDYRNTSVYTDVVAPRRTRTAGAAVRSRRARRSRPATSRRTSSGTRCPDGWSDPRTGLEPRA